MPSIAYSVAVPSGAPPSKANTTPLTTIGGSGDCMAEDSQAFSSAVETPLCVNFQAAIELPVEATILLVPDSPFQTAKEVSSSTLLARAGALATTFSRLLAA